MKWVFWNSKRLLNSFRSDKVAVAVSAKCGTLGNMEVNCPSSEKALKKSFPCKYIDIVKIFKITNLENKMITNDPNKYNTLHTILRPCVLHLWLCNTCVWYFGLQRILPMSLFLRNVSGCAYRRKNSPILISLMDTFENTTSSLAKCNWSFLNNRFCTHYIICIKRSKTAQKVYLF